ncbi:MAG: ATP-binding cassette domain-containing protein [Alphaproteobacteria bacterium]
MVGESGCGKSTLARAILRLIPVTAGEIAWIGGEDLCAARQSACVGAGNSRSCSRSAGEPRSAHDRRRFDRRAPTRAPPLGGPALRAEVKAMMGRVASTPPQSTAIRTSSPAGRTSASGSPAP